MENYRNYKQAGSANSSSGHNAAEEDDEVESLKAQIRGVKQDSLAATRNAVSKLAESEDVASNTLSKLGKQSEKINSIDRQMEMADIQADRALDKSGELKRINNSMFSTFSIKNPFKSKSEAKKLEELKQNHLQQIKRDDELRAANQEAQKRVGDVLNPRGGNSPVPGGSGSRTPTSGGINSQYNFEEDEDGENIEREIDGNLDSISSALGRLKNMSLAMSEEITTQNDKLDRINDNATKVQTKVQAGKDRLKTIK